MQDRGNELDVLMNEIYALREQVNDLESRLHTVEQDNEVLLRENEWLQGHLPKEIANQFNIIYDEIWDLGQAMKRHCNSFHSMLILGGKKDEDNIS